MKRYNYSVRHKQIAPCPTAPFKLLVGIIGIVPPAPLARKEYLTKHCPLPVKRAGNILENIAPTAPIRSAVSATAASLETDRLGRAWLQEPRRQLKQAISHMCWPKNQRP